MALLIPNNGEGDALAGIVGKTACENLVLCLFKSNTTPGETDTTASYTEATFTGYAAITLTAANWTVVEGKAGTVNTAGTAVTSASGDNFTGLIAGGTIIIAGVTYTIASFTDSTHLVLTATAGTQSGVAYTTPTFAYYAQQTFTSSANQTAELIYGYFLKRVSSGRIAWAERFSDAPYSVSNLGDLVKVTPVVTLD